MKVLGRLEDWWRWCLVWVNLGRINESRVGEMEVGQRASWKQLLKLSFGIKRPWNQLWGLLEEEMWLLLKKMECVLLGQGNNPEARHGFLSVCQLYCIPYVVQNLKASKQTLRILHIDFMITLCRREADNKTFKECCSQSLITFRNSVFSTLYFGW